MKKLLLSLGTITVMVVPTISIISCSMPEMTGSMNYASSKTVEELNEIDVKSYKSLPDLYKAYGIYESTGESNMIFVSASYDKKAHKLTVVEKYSGDVSGKVKTTIELRPSSSNK